MPSYSNGYITDSMLITFNVGVSAGEGVWKHQLSPSTYAKHLALVLLARKNTGRTLQISPGWGAYRPMPAQVYARKVHGRGAADPGTSSHGGFWEGQQTLAIDYGNWSYVYNGNRAAFYRDVRAVGLEPGLISVGRGYPDEPWHVVDKQPWAGGSAAGGVELPNSAGAKPAPKVRRKSMITAAYRNDDGSFAIQRDPNGPLVWIGDTNEWEGILAANPGLKGHQVSNAWLRAHMDKWGLIPRFTPPASDLPTVVTVIGSKSQYMQTSSGMVPIDSVTASALADRGAVSYAVSQTVAEALLAKPASDS